MSAWITSILSIITAIIGWFGIGKAKEPDLQGQAIDTANDMGKASADAARSTHDTINKDKADVDAQTASDVTSLRSARGVRDKRVIVADAIARANKDT